MGVRPRLRAGAGRRLAHISFEAGPDDDVDVILASGRRSIEVEVFCNGGVPVVSDREVKFLPDR